MHTSRIAELAATIQASVAKLDTNLEERGIPSPSFGVNSVERLPADTADVQDVILDATLELHDLLLEPMTLLFQKGAHNNMVCLQTISHLGIAALVPLDGKISFEELSQKVGVSEQFIRRVLRHAATLRVFQEPEIGMISHTKASKILATSTGNDWMKVATEDVWPTATKMFEAVKKWPAAEEPNETGFSIANGTSQSIYDVFGSNPEKAIRFATAMKAYTSSPEFDISYVLDCYDWASLGQACLVDVGGSQGHIAAALAQRFNNLEVVVQDTEASIAGAIVPEGLETRMRFMAHNFFQPQPVKADVYYFRWVMHNWSDKYCIQILRSLIPALQNGARIVIQDTCLPEPGVRALWRERDLRSADLNMAAMFNGKERSSSEWKDLLASADSRFVLKQINEPAGSALAIIDARWEESD
ncbi:S-adenosyl-L-methionine-dependent methyltransferase [Xylariaceae sp. FL0255]|nr:S-adenosyl-L-methionine-dependent methyltransferase [Xylariaceae sp. FL0255]